MRGRRNGLFPQLPLQLLDLVRLSGLDRAQLFDFGLLLHQQAAQISDFIVGERFFTPGADEAARQGQQDHDIDC